MSGNDAAAEFGAVPVLRFARRLRHPREMVWRALTEDDHLDAWFPTTIEGARATSAPLRFSFREGEGDSFTGAMRVFDPPSVMELQWGPDIVRFELHREGDTVTRLDLVVTFSEWGKASRDGAGWHVCLDRLVSVIDGVKPTWSVADRWREVHRVYVEQLGPDASVLGPPEEWERANPPSDQ